MGLREADKGVSELRFRMIATATTLVTLALVLQVSVVARLPFPGEVIPDLVLLVVLSLGLATGPLSGAFTGFFAGLATDLVPPAFHAIGRFALVYCLVGYFAGMAAKDVENSPVLPFFAVATGALGGSLLYVGTGAVLGDPRITWDSVVYALPLSTLYDVLLSPFVLYAVIRLTDRLELAPVRSQPWRL